MNRLTDNDKKFGPVTFAKWKGEFSVYLNSGDEEHAESYLMVIAFGWAMRLRIPSLFVRPLKIKRAAGWDAATIERLGRDWYYVIHERRFGVSLSDMGNGYDFFQLFFGARTHDSSTTKSWSKHLPWKQWRCVRTSIYNPDGTHFYTEQRGQDFLVWWAEKEKCPKVHFGFEDYDGEMIVATCMIEEMEWHRGEGWFKWLRWFFQPKVRRSLDIHFNAEVGPEKGSYKGGTIGHGIEMLSHETPRLAFERYCAKEHNARGRKYRIRFVGPCQPPVKEVHAS